MLHVSESWVQYLCECDTRVPKGEIRWGFLEYAWSGVRVKTSFSRGIFHLVFFGRRTRPIRLLWWVTLNQHLRLDLLINRFVNLIDNHVTGFRFLSFNSGERSHSDCSLLSHFCWRLFRFYKRETTLACWTWVNFSCLWFSGTRRQASVVCKAWGELRSVDSS